MLDMDAHPPHQYIQQVFPVGRVLSEQDARVGENLKSAAVGNLEDGVSVRPGHDQILDVHRLADR